MRKYKSIIICAILAFCFLLPSGLSSWIIGSLTQNYDIERVPIETFVSPYIVAYDSANNRYRTIDDAISSVTSGTITVIPTESLGNYNDSTPDNKDDEDLKRARTITKTSSLAANVKINIPHSLSASQTYVKENNANNTNFPDATDSRAYVSNEIFIGDNVVFTMNAGSSIDIGGVHDVATTGSALGLHNALKAATNYAQLILGSGTIVNCYGTITCSGYIKETDDGLSRINFIGSGANFYEPLVIYDWPNGTAGTGSIGEAFPFNFFNLPFAHTTLIFDYYSNFYAYMYFRVANGYSTTVSETIRIMSSNSSAFVQISDSTSKVRWRFSSGQKDSNGYPITPYINESKKTYIEIDGNAQVKEISFSFSGYNVKSSDYDLPINAEYRFVVKDGGVLTSPYSLNFLPGSELIVEKGGTLNLNGKTTFFMSSRNNDTDKYTLYKYSTFFPTIYSNSISSNQTLKFSAAAKLKVGGQAIINNNFGGYIVLNDDSTSSGANATQVSFGSSYKNSSTVTAFRSTGSPYYATFSFGALIPTPSIQNSTIVKEYSVPQKSQTYTKFNEECFNCSSLTYTITFAYDPACVIHDLPDITNLSYSSIFRAPGESSISKNGFNLTGWKYQNITFEPNQLYMMTDFVNLSSAPLTITLEAQWELKPGYTSRNVVYRKYQGDSLVNCYSTDLLVGDTITLGYDGSESRDPDISDDGKYKAYTFANYVIASQNYSKGISFTIPDGDGPLYIDPVFDYSLSSFSLSLSGLSGDLSSSTKITATLSPTIDKSLTYEWTSSDTSIVKIESTSGNTCTINKATNSSSATLTCVCKYNSITLASNSMSVSTSSCILEGTMITLADGSLTAVENISVGDYIRTWNLETGTFDAQPVILVEKTTDIHELLTLQFSNGESISVAYGQSFFDADLRDWIKIYTFNVADMIGRNVMVDNNGSLNSTTIIGYTIETQECTVYELITAFDYNFFANGLMTATPLIPDHVFFEVDEEFKYDPIKKEQDIALYGLYEYAQFEELLTYEQFLATNTPYWKIAVAKGYCDEAYVYQVIDMFLNLDHS